MKKLIAVTILFLAIQNNLFAESNSVAVGYSSGKEIKTGPDTTNDFVVIDLTQNSDVASQIIDTNSPYWEGGVASSSEAEDVILGYGSNHSLTFKKDGRILDSKGREITTDTELVQKLWDSLNGICR